MKNPSDLKRIESYQDKTRDLCEKTGRIIGGVTGMATGVDASTGAEAGARVGQKIADFVFGDKGK